MARPPAYGPPASWPGRRSLPGQQRSNELAHLAGPQKFIPEKTPEKVSLAKQMQAARKRGEGGGGLSDWNIRWVGPEGYKGIVARQLQQFKRVQKERAAAAAPESTE